MEIDNSETAYALIRQGYYQENLIFKLNQKNVIGMKIFTNSDIQRTGSFKNIVSFL